MTEPRGGHVRPTRTGAMVRVREVPAEDPAATAAVERYYDELRALFTAGFDPGPSRLDQGAFLLATCDGITVGCGGLQPLDTTTGEVKRMWVDPTWRGAGLGARLLRELEDAARQRGCSRVVLDTSDQLHDAIALYERAGYVAVPAYNDNPYARHWFAKDVSGVRAQDETPG